MRPPTICMTRGWSWPAPAALHRRLIKRAFSDCNDAYPLMLLASDCECQLQSLGYGDLKCQLTFQRRNEAPRRRILNSGKPLRQLPWQRLRTQRNVRFVSSNCDLPTDRQHVPRSQQSASQGPFTFRGRSADLRQSEYGLACSSEFVERFRINLWVTAGSMLNALSNRFNGSIRRTSWHLAKLTAEWAYGFNNSDACYHVLFHPLTPSQIDGGAANAYERWRMRQRWHELVSTAYNWPGCGNASSPLCGVHSSAICLMIACYHSLTGVM